MTQPLQRAKVYRNVELAQQWLGLEPFDTLAVVTVGWTLMLVNRHGVGWNVLILVLAYAGLRIGKRGKPEGYTRSLVRHYVLRRPFFTAAAPDLQATSHRFPHQLPPADAGAEAGRLPVTQRGALAPRGEGR